MRIIAFDLAMKTTGVCEYNDGQYSTNVIKETITGAFRIGDFEQIHEAVEHLITACGETLPDYILVEWNNIRTNPKFMMYGMLVCLELKLRFKAHVIPIKADRWMKKADEIFAVHRKGFDKGRDGNKDWIRACAQHIHPNFKTRYQDCYDAMLMLDTYLEKPKYF